MKHLCNVTPLCKQAEVGSSEKSLPGFSQRVLPQQFNSEVVKAWVVVAGKHLCLPAIDRKNNAFCERNLGLYETIVILFLPFCC